LTPNQGRNKKNLSGLKERNPYIIAKSGTTTP